jgi:hypothetical protein
METIKISDVIIIDYEITMTKADNEKAFCCYIPQYDIYYGAKDEESARKKGEAMVRMWIDFCHKLAKNEIPEREK